MNNSDISFLSFISEMTVTVPNYECFKNVTNKLANVNKDKLKKFSPEFFKTMEIFHQPFFVKMMNISDKKKRLVLIEKISTKLSKERSMGKNVVAESLMWAVLNYKSKINEMRS